MDEVYRRQRHFYDFTRKYYLFGRDRLIAELRLKPGERLVEVGCGTARNLVKAARAYPQAKLFGLDASAEMLKTAQASIARAGLGGRIRLRQGYAENLSPALFGEQASFDVALFSYSLSMIPDWRGALLAAGAAITPEGTICIVDFADFTGLPKLARRILLSWLKLFHVAPKFALIESLEATTVSGAGGSLTMLGGRYAFLLSLKKQALEAALAPVAPSPQISTKFR